MCHKNQVWCEECSSTNPNAQKCIDNQRRKKETPCNHVLRQNKRWFYVMDMVAVIYTTRFKSHRWTMNGLVYILDTVRTSMFALRNAMQSDYNIGSFNFMRRFGEDLIKPHVQIHYQNVTGFQRHEKENWP